MSIVVSSSAPSADSPDSPGTRIADDPARANRNLKKEKKTTGRGVVIDIAILVGAALIGAFGMKTFVAQVFSIPSMSMQNTVAVGERVIVEKISYRTGEPSPGDVVVFDGTGLFAEPMPGANTFIKRVIGVGGDRVACCDASGQLTRNGVPIDESSYLKPGQAPSDLRFNVTVPANRLWVMGDNRAESADSRAYLAAPGGGFVPTERVIGKAMAVAWPLSSARWIETGENRS